MLLELGDYKLSGLFNSPARLDTKIQEVLSVLHELSQLKAAEQGQPVQ